MHQKRFLDQKWESGVQADNHEQVTSADSTDVAYIITSGTTGTPKVVAVTYGSLNLYLESMSEALDIGHDDVYLKAG